MTRRPNARRGDVQDEDRDSGGVLIVYVFVALLGWLVLGGATYVACG